MSDHYLIKGKFFIVGFSPDADSVKFRADNPLLWQKIETENREALEKNLKEDQGIVTLRFQGVDALETHYRPPTIPVPQGLITKSKEAIFPMPKPHDHRQPKTLGNAATDALVNLMGIQEITWRTFGKNTWVKKAVLKNGTVVEEKGKDALEGYIISSDVELNGRPLAWVFMGNPPEKDGTPIEIAALAERLHESLNYQLMRKGIVYPYFYMTLSAKLRIPLAQAAQRAVQETLEGKNNETGNVWKHDATIQGMAVTQVKQLHEEFAIYPYLFRKILKHWYEKRMQQFFLALDGKAAPPVEDDWTLDLEGFFEGGNPYLFVSSEQDFMRLDSVLTVGHQKIKLLKAPYDFVFLS